MGFTVKLALAYLILAVIIIALFKTSRKRAGKACTILVVVASVVLNVLWMTSPM